MSLKILASIMVIVASSLIGLIKSSELKKRPNHIRTFIGMLSIFQNEICFMSSILSDVFKKIYKSTQSPVGEFFKETLENLEQNSSTSLANAWEIAVSNNIKNTAFDEEDKEILISFGKMLGMSDLEGQVNNITLTMKQLEIQEKKAEEKKKNSEAMYKSLGFLGGLTIVIVLF